MCRTGRTLHEYMGMGAAGMVALAHFVRHIDTDSATWRAVNGRTGWAGWNDRYATNRILTDVYDAIVAMHYNYVRAHSKKKGGKPPKPYPAPWARKDKESRHLGKDPVKARDFWGWWNKKKGGDDGRR